MPNNIMPFSLNFDMGKLMQVIKKYIIIYMEKAVVRLIEIMEKEVQMTVYGNGPGRTEWRRQMAASMHKVYESISDNYFEYGVGLDIFKDNIGFIQAMIVTEGSGFWVGGSPITAGPPGRSVFDKGFNLHPSDAQTVWELPNGFNQPGNDWLEASRDIFMKEYPDIVSQITNGIPRSEILACVSTK